MNTPTSFDLDSLRLGGAPPPSGAAARMPRHRPGEAFLKGPIPLQWLARAVSLTGKALHVAIAIWFLAGMKRLPTVSLQPSVLRHFGIKRHAAYRGLTALEKAGLVSVERHRGRAPRVTLLPTQVP
jgi:hypothetical protein